MIEFATLLLGLASGPQRVDLRVTPEVASVVLALDGSQVATAQGPPWSLEFDLGTNLSPSELVASAYGSDGQLLDQATQLLNVPRPQAELTIALDNSSDGLPTRAELLWESSVRQSPQLVLAELGGEPLETSGFDWIELPELDPSSTHFLQVELVFSDQVSAQDSVVFGGTFGESAEVELTAVPVVADKPGRRLAPQELAGALTHQGSPLRIVAVEDASAEIVVVRGPGVDERLASLEGLSSRAVSGAVGFSGMGGLEQVGSSMSSVSSTAEQQLRRSFELRDSERLRLIAPYARLGRGNRVSMDLFPISPQLEPRHGGLYWALSLGLELPGLDSRLRMADAVAMAGLQAAQGNRQRAVLVVLADPLLDQSRHSTSSVKRLLEDLGVPLVVWQLGEVRQPVGQWQSAETVTSVRELRRALSALRDTIDSQRILWVEGDYLLKELGFPSHRAIKPMSKAASGGR